MPLLFDFIYRQFIHYPPAPTASFKGRTCVVTGSNVGLGLDACRWMVQLGASKVIIACRNVEKGKVAAKDIQETTSCSADNLDVWQLDLSSYASIKAFADKAKAELPRLDALCLNAGIGTRTFREVDGVEESINTNVISPFLLGFLLLPKLRETASKYKTQTHMTVTASELYEFAAFKEYHVPEGQIFATLNNKETANMNDRYNVTKLLEVLMVRQMATMYPLDSDHVIINSVAPGLCASSLHREYDSAFVRILMKILARPTMVGARTIAYGASAGPESHGEYLPDCRITKLGGLCKGKEGVGLQKRVWEELKEILEAIQPGVTSLS